MNFKNVFYFLLTAILAAVGVYLYRKAGAVADFAKKTVTETLNPASDKNIAYRGASAVARSLTGYADHESDATLGTILYDTVETFKKRAAAATEAYHIMSEKEDEEKDVNPSWVEP